MYTPQTAIDFIQKNLPDFFGKDAQLKAAELSDGNINYVFRVEDENGKSLIIKHAEDTLRVNTNRHIGFDRSKIECEVLKLQREYCPALIPEVYLYDETEHNIVMVTRTCATSFVTIRSSRTLPKTWQNSAVRRSSDLRIWSSGRKRKKSW